MTGKKHNWGDYLTYDFIFPSYRIHMICFLVSHVDIANLNPLTPHNSMVTNILNSAHPYMHCSLVNIVLCQVVYFLKDTTGQMGP